MKTSNEIKGSAVVRIPLDLDQRLSAMALQTGRSKTYYMKKALARFLEDLEDYYLALAAREESKDEPTYTFEEIKRELRLDHRVHAKGAAPVQNPADRHPSKTRRTVRKKIA